MCVIYIMRRRIHVCHIYNEEEDTCVIYIMRRRIHVFHMMLSIHS
jgi:hypothetical protein